MIKEFFKRSRMAKLLNPFTIGGSTIAEILWKGDSSNFSNTKRQLLNLYKTSKRQNLPPETFDKLLKELVNRRKKDTILTLKDIMSGVRNELRGRFTRNVVEWENVGVFDANQTDLCRGYMGKTWAKWSDLKPIDKPPRHIRCRSSVLPVKKGQSPVNQDAFIAQFNRAGSEKQREILGKGRYDLWKEGKIKINTFSQFENIRKLKLKEARGIKL